MCGRTTIIRQGFGLGVCLLVAACGGGGGSSSNAASSEGGTTAPTTVTPPTSTSQTIASVLPISSNEVDVALSNEENQSIDSARVGLIAYVTGIDLTTNTVNAHSGFQTVDVGAVVTSGTATYDARFGVGISDNVEVTSEAITTSRLTNSSGTMTLNADFSNGTLTGSGSSVSAGTSLDVNGTISGQSVGGEVLIIHPNTIDNGATSDSVSASLTGEIGADGVVGAFAGRDENTVAAGGFVGTRD